MPLSGAHSLLTVWSQKTRQPLVVRLDFYTARPLVPLVPCIYRTTYNVRLKTENSFYLRSSCSSVQLQSTLAPAGCVSLFVRTHASINVHIHVCVRHPLFSIPVPFQGPVSRFGFLCTEFYTPSRSSSGIFLSLEMFPHRSLWQERHTDDSSPPLLPLLSSFGKACSLASGNRFIVGACIHPHRSFVRTP